MKVLEVDDDGTIRIDVNFKFKPNMKRGVVELNFNNSIVTFNKKNNYLGYSLKKYAFYSEVN